MHNNNNKIKTLDSTGTGKFQFSYDKQIELGESKFTNFEVIPQEKLIPNEKIAGQDKLTFEAISTLIGGFILCFAACSSLALGTLIVYIVSYYRVILQYDVDENTFMSLFPLLLVFNTVFFFIANRFIDRLGSRIVASLIGFFGISLCFLSIMIPWHPYVFIFMFSLGFGSMKGTMYSSSLRAGWSHLPKRKGLASGVILSGSGMGGGIASLCIFHIINPNGVEPILDKHDGNLYFPKELVKFYPEIQIRLCVIWTILMLIGICLISNFKQEEQILPVEEYENYSENSSTQFEQQA